MNRSFHGVIVLATKSLNGTKPTVQRRMIRLKTTYLYICMHIYVLIVQVKCIIICVQLKIKNGV